MRLLHPYRFIDAQPTTISGWAILLHLLARLLPILRR